MKSARMFLRYSRAAIIHLHGYGGSSKLDVSTRRLARELKKQLQAATDRIVSFHITEPNRGMLHLWPFRAPNIEEMIINTKAPFPPVFSGDMPLLRSIVTPIMNSHHYLMVRNLTSLTLYPPYTLQKLLAILNITQMLRRLELRKIHEFARDDLPRVSLPHLEDLSLSDCYHPITGFINFPAQTRITTSVPDHLENGVSWSNIDIISSFFIPPAFLRSSSMTITVKEARHSTEVRITGQDTGDKYQCHVFIDLKAGSSAKHQYRVCMYAMAMVRKLTSVSTLQFSAHVLFPADCTKLFGRFRNLKVLTLIGPCVCPVLLDVVSAEINTLPSLKHVVVDRKFLPIFRKFKDWLASQEWAGHKVADYMDVDYMDAIEADE